MVGIAQLVRAPDCGSGGREFDSHYPPHFYKATEPSGKAVDCNSLIPSSNLGVASIIINAPIAQLDRVSDYESEG